MKIENLYRGFLKSTLLSCWNLMESQSKNMKFWNKNWKKLRTLKCRFWGLRTSKIEPHQVFRTLNKIREISKIHWKISALWSGSRIWNYKYSQNRSSSQINFFTSKNCISGTEMSSNACKISSMKKWNWSSLRSRISSSRSKTFLLRSISASLTQPSSWISFKSLIYLTENAKTPNFESWT